MRPSQKSRNGSAILLALVTIVVFSSIVVAFLFRIHVEEEIAIQARFGFKALELARGGQEVAKSLLIRSKGVAEDVNDENATSVAEQALREGNPLVGYPVPFLQEGEVFVSIRPENSWREVNLLSDTDWELLLEESGVPSEHHSALIDSFRDWMDADDQNRLQGAEEDDEFYQANDIPVKNAPLTVLGELGSIKGFTPAILYGGSLEEFYGEPEVMVNGIASKLTVHGDGKINLQSASKEVLATVSGLRETQVDALMESRLGLDGRAGTEDDGFVNVADALSAAGIGADLSGVFTLSDYSWARIQSIGRVGGVSRVIEAVYNFNGRTFVLYSYEEFSP